MNYLIFSVDNQQFGVSLAVVKRVIWAVSVTPVHENSKNLLGIINIHNEVIPVVNIRKILGLSSKDIDLSDQFIICNFPNTKAALWVDKVEEIKKLEDAEVTPGDTTFNRGSGVSSVLKSEGNLITVYDWETFVNEVINPEVHV